MINELDNIVKTLSKKAYTVGRLSLSSKEILKNAATVGVCAGTLSCKKDEIPTPQPITTTAQPTTPTVSTPSTPTTTSYGIIIKNTHPTKTITGLLIDGKLQKLDVGNYPIGKNQDGYGKSHDPICSTVEFTKGCTTMISVTYGGTGSFNSIKS